MGISYLKSTIETGTFGSGGAAPSASDAAIKINGFDYKVDRGLMADDTTDSFNTSAVYGGALKVSGSIDAAFRPTCMAPLLTSLMGTPSPAGTYALAEPVPINLDIGEAVGSVTKSHLFTGVGVNSCEFTFEAKEFVKTKWDWIGCEPKDSTYDTAVTYPVEDPIVFWRASLAVGATTIYSKSVSLTIDRSLDSDQFVLGNFKLYRLVRTGITDVSGTLGITEEQIDELDRAMYGTTAGTSVPATNDVGNGSLVITCLKVAGTPGVTFTLPVYYSVSDVKHSGVGEFDKSIEYKVVGTGMSIVVA